MKSYRLPFLFVIILFGWCLDLAAQGLGNSPEIISIEFNGNTLFSSMELSKQLNIKSKSLFSKGTLYNKHHVLQEGIRLRNFYKQHGYLDAQVRDSLVYINENRAQLLYFIQEGPQYYLNHVSIQGNDVISDSVYNAILGVKEGSPFNAFAIRDQLRIILRQYEEDGYPLIHIQDSVVVTDSVKYFISVREGPRFRIGNIYIPSTPDIPSEIISRELIIAEGDIFNISLIEESKRRLFETNLFNSVNIRTGKVDTTASVIALNVEVIPAKFKAFDIDFGAKQIRAYKNADPVVSIGMAGSWYHTNLFSSSRKFKIQTQINSIYPDIFIPYDFNVDLFYVEPWIFNMRIPVTFNPFYIYLYESSSNFKSIANGLRFITTYRWFRKIRVLSLFEWSTVKSEGTPVAELNENVYVEQRKIELKLSWDERDNYFSPKSGYKFILEPRIIGHVLGGEDHYWQVESACSTYWSVIGKLVFAQNINIAMAKTRESTEIIPYQERFFLGGNTSVRGFSQRGLGPSTISQTSGETIPTGGNMRLYANFELRFPLYKILGGEIFSDVGYLWPEISDFSLDDLQSAFGAGLTFETPIGPARIDYGVPVYPHLSLDNGQMHIAIAYAF